MIHLRPSSRIRLVTFFRTLSLRMRNSPSLIREWTNAWGASLVRAFCSIQHLGMLSMLKRLERQHIFISIPNSSNIGLPIRQVEAVNQILPSITIEELCLNRIFNTRGKKLPSFRVPCLVSAVQRPQSTRYWPPATSSTRC